MNALDTIAASQHADTCFDLLHEMFNSRGSMLQRMADMHERDALDLLTNTGLVAKCPERGQHHLTPLGRVEYSAACDALADDYLGGVA